MTANPGLPDQVTRFTPSPVCANVPAHASETRSHSFYAAEPSSFPGAAACRRFVMLMDHNADGEGLQTS
jgi:hypothetical protein